MRLRKKRPFLFSCFCSSLSVSFSVPMEYLGFPKATVEFSHNRSSESSFAAFGSASVSLSFPSTGGSWVLAVCLGHRYPGRRFPGDPEDLLRQVLQGGRQLEWRGLDHSEGRLQTKGRRFYLFVINLENENSSTAAFGISHLTKAAG